MFFDYLYNLIPKPLIKAFRSIFPPIPNYLEEILKDPSIVVNIEDFFCERCKASSYRGYNIKEALGDKHANSSTFETDWNDNRVRVMKLKVDIANGIYNKRFYT